jgi:hypothetical protein
MGNHGSKIRIKKVSKTSKHTIKVTDRLKKVNYVCLKEKVSWVLVTYAYNPSYSGGRDQDNWRSKPAWGNTATRPYLGKKKKITKKSWQSGSRCRP